MYHRPYQVNAYFKMEALTKVADFYCALPVISTTLGGALQGSLMFQKLSSLVPSTEFLKHLSNLVFIAKKLRNDVLFQDCMIVIAGKWSFSMVQCGEAGRTYYDAANDPELGPLIKREAATTCRKVADIQHSILFHTMHLGWRPENTPNAPQCRSYNIHFYRNLWLELQKNMDSLTQLFVDSEQDFEELEEDLRDLLKNNLILDQTHDNPGDEGGAFGSYLLCAKIKDVDLPWDVSEIDW